MFELCNLDILKYVNHSLNVNYSYYFGVLSIVLINCLFMLNFHRIQHKTIDNNYSSSTHQKIKKLLSKEMKNPIIAFLLSDSTIQNNPPVIWYPNEPAPRKVVSSHPARRQTLSVAFCVANGI